ncbi:exodeoxyribonuclease VII small subunit [Botrimarina mediterranea]|uniref:Exodeoxyribonuclease 7 small subunit n=1 Tax=Botrimarina mediterranea TaxID=2528022 RepID=A0A518KAM5_9BACT|nr:exodeoxyribonuclease VII small subunit [Botrimarina mediterranea]QDV74837.1 Exodeoxyribonuclease 7 small subunit [Botrimarina mediterranea]QDV79480.1 Exodeoxyribonuclease 7 small subunit [Planctomycetes bacterium K2D]
MAKKPAAAKKATPDAAEPFEESLAELETIVADLEGGELGLSDALARYEEGVRRLKQCHTQLQAAERRIELLSGVDADGNPVTTPFDDSATADDRDATARSKKRSATSAGAKGSAGATGQASSRQERAGVDEGSRLF